MSDAATAEKSFEENLAELEAVVRDLDDGKTSLETAIKRYEQGIGLLKACTAMLREAEQRILLLTGTDEQGAATTEPFEHTSAVAPDRPGPKKRKSVKPDDDAEVPF